MEAREVPGLLRFCGRARHAWAPAAAAAAKRAAWRKGQKPPGRSKSAGRPERACQGWWRQSLPVVALGPRPGAGKASRGCGRAAGGKKVLAKRQCPFCRWMRAPRSRPHKIGQGSSVGQSMRSIPAVSGGTLPCYQRIKKPGLWKSWAFLFCCTASRICSLPGHAQPGSATGKASAPAQKQVASGSVPDEVTGVFVPQCLKDQ